MTSYELVLCAWGATVAGDGIGLTTLKLLPTGLNCMYLNKTERFDPEVFISMHNEDSTHVSIFYLKGL